MYWSWNIPLKKSAKTPCGVIAEDPFDLAARLGVSGEDLSHARIVAFSDNAPVIEAGNIRLSNPWLNPEGTGPADILTDRQVYRRWRTEYLVAYIAKAKEIAA